MTIKSFVFFNENTKERYVLPVINGKNLKNIFEDIDSEFHIFSQNIEFQFGEQYIYDGEDFVGWMSHEIQPENWGLIIEMYRQFFIKEKICSPNATFHIKRLT